MAAEMKIDLSEVRMTNKDMVDFKRITGKSMALAFKDADSPEWAADPDFEAITALTWVLARKQNPGFTYEDALNAEVDAPLLVEAVKHLNPTPAPTPTPNGARRRKTS